jgi:hypothetical protein
MEYSNWVYQQNLLPKLGGTRLEGSAVKRSRHRDPPGIGEYKIEKGFPMVESKSPQWSVPKHPRELMSGLILQVQSSSPHIHSSDLLLSVGDSRNSRINLLPQIGQYTVTEKNYKQLSIPYLKKYQL